MASQKTFATVARPRVTIKRLSSPKEFTATLAHDVKEGLSPHNPQRWLPPKYRYDDEGSSLVEEITRTPEYYLARAETDILRKFSKEIMEFAQPEELIELGSGSSVKTKVLIEAMHTTGCKIYTPFDVSEVALREAVSSLKEEYEWLYINGLIGDYDSDIPKLRSNNRFIIVILGSTIGSYVKDERISFLKSLRAVMKDGDFLLLGLDLFTDEKDHLGTYMD